MIDIGLEAGTKVAVGHAGLVAIDPVLVDTDGQRLAEGGNLAAEPVYADYMVLAEHVPAEQTGHVDVDHVEPDHVGPDHAGPESTGELAHWYCTASAGCAWVAGTTAVLANAILAPSDPEREDEVDTAEGGWPGAAQAVHGLADEAVADPAHPDLVEVAAGNCLAANTVPGGDLDHHEQIAVPAGVFAHAAELVVVQQKGLAESAHTAGHVNCALVCAATTVADSEELDAEADAEIGTVIHTPLGLPGATARPSYPMNRVHSSCWHAGDFVSLAQVEARVDEQRHTECSSMDQQDCTQAGWPTGLANSLVASGFRMLAMTPCPRSYS